MVTWLLKANFKTCKKTRRAKWNYKLFPSAVVNCLHTHTAPVSFKDSCSQRNKKKVVVLMSLRLKQHSGNVCMKTTLVVWLVQLRSNVRVCEGLKSDCRLPWVSRCSFQYLYVNSEKMPLKTGKLSPDKPFRLHHIQDWTVSVCLSVCPVSQRGFRVTRVGAGKSPTFWASSDGLHTAHNRLPYFSSHVKNRTRTAP